MFSIAENNGITVLLYDPNQVQNPDMTNEVRMIISLICLLNFPIVFSSTDILGCFIPQDFDLFDDPVFNFFNVADHNFQMVYTIFPFIVSIRKSGRGNVLEKGGGSTYIKLMLPNA